MTQHKNKMFIEILLKVGVLNKAILVNWEIINDFNKEQSYILGHENIKRKSILVVWRK